MAAPLLTRTEVPLEHTWDLASVYLDLAAWEADARVLEAALPELAAMAGKLTASAANLQAMFTLSERLQVLVRRLFVYAGMNFDVDTTNQAAAGLRDQAFGLFSRLMATAAFIEPELLAADPARLEALLAEEPALAIYQHYLVELRRNASHIRSAEVEGLLAQASDPLRTAYSAFQVLAESDLRFAPATDSTGTSYEVSTSTFNTLLASPDRTLRQNAWLSHQDAFLAFKNTFGTIYGGSVRGDVFQARARNFPSTLAQKLFANNLPQAVYDNVISACNRHLPIWHRYWDLRRRALGIETLTAYDVFAPLTSPPNYPYADAADLICEAMTPLGEEYVTTARAGLTHQRWVDIYPNRGKTSGAYSGGGYDTHPFILMNFDGGLPDVSTLAHELGHSMHSWYTCKHQPLVYAGYSLFVAEVASNFNQALLRGHLLAQQPSREVEIAILEEAMNNFHRYLFLMPILSQLEQYAHEQVESGQPITADLLGARLADLFQRGYGPAATVDPDRDGIIWAQFPHLYEAYYVYQYASGIAAANALAADLLAGVPEARERYLRFLSAGSSLYPLEALAVAGIDMTDPAPMDRAFAILDQYVSRLEGLVG
ncbi:MAG: oligoendopeptidase F [Oscillochloridaceae bacterium umkhey_bin13]